MAKAYHEALHPLGNLGIQVSMAALESPHLPMHWHEAMEILFCLNGEVTIHVDHETITLTRNQLIVFDSSEVHSIHSSSNLYRDAADARAQRLARQGALADRRTDQDGTRHCVDGIARRGGDRKSVV